MLSRLHEYLLTIREQVLPRARRDKPLLHAEELDRADPLLRRRRSAIDNNATERSLRSFAVGRHNWTFSDGQRRKTAAVLRSFVSSCELVRIDPFAGSRCARTIAEHPISARRAAADRWLRYPANRAPIYTNIRLLAIIRKGFTGAYSHTSLMAESTTKALAPIGKLIATL